MLQFTGVAVKWKSQLLEVGPGNTGFPMLDSSRRARKDGDSQVNRGR